MKFFLASIFLIFIFESCFFIVKKTKFFSANYTSYTSKDAEKVFIELNDGTIIEDSTASGKLTFLHVKKILGDKWRVKIRGVEYGEDKIVAYQSNKKYLRKIKPGWYFVEILIRGKINVYDDYTPSSTSSISNVTYSSTNTYYLQKGDKEPLEKYSHKRLELMINDNSLALSKLEAYRKMSNRQWRKNYKLYLDEVLMIYNTTK